MKTRLFAMGAVFFAAAALAACGGGGGGGNPTPVTPPVSTPTPTPKPTPNAFGCVGSSPYAIARRPMAAAAPHPIAPGDTFAYTGTEVVTYTQSAPCPQPTSTSRATVASNVTNYATSAPAGATTDQRSVESDAFPTKTVTTTTDLAVATTATAFQLFQTKSSDDSGNVVTMTYANPQQLDLLSGSPPQSWGGTSTNNPAGTLTESLADGTQITRNISSDGSYIDNETYADGDTATITVQGEATGLGAPNGAGSYAFPALGLTYAFAGPSGGTITLSVTSGGSPQTRTYTAWFAIPSSYISDNFTTSAGGSLDAGCASGLPAVTKQIVETYTDVDPVVGYNETRTTTSWDADGYGAVCVKIDDVVNSFYDYSGDTTVGLFLAKNAVPNSTNHITEVLSMTAPATPYLQARTRRSAAQSVSEQEIASRVASIEHIREIERAQRLEQLHEAMTISTRGQSIK